MATINDYGSPTDPANAPSVSAWAAAVRDAITSLTAQVSEGTVPAAGTTGQVLAKASDNDFDTEWVDPSGGGGSTSLYAYQLAASTVTATQTRTSTSGSAYPQFTCDVHEQSYGRIRIEQIAWNGAHVADTYELFLDGVSQGTQVVASSYDTATWTGLTHAGSSIEIKIVGTASRTFGYNTANGGYTNNGLVFEDWQESTGNTLPAVITYRVLELVEFLATLA